MSKIWEWIIGAGALAAGLLAALFAAKRSGVNQERQAQKDKAFEQSKESNEIDSKVRSSTDADVDKRLSKYQRD